MTLHTPSLQRGLGVGGDMMTVNASDDILKGYDEEQVRLMAEMCIEVDENDNATGAISKKDAHLMTNINKGALHRAFSVFLFNSEGKLLLQKRASEKITFPDCWTNTCCSHPLTRPDEIITEQQKGVKTAAIRKLEQELGIKPEQVPIEDFVYLTRIHYLAPSDGLWGEHEIDYILFIKKDVDVEPNPNEVSEVKYVTPAELKDIFATADATNTKITPWFRLICNEFLFPWWEKLDCLKTCVDAETIHRL